MAWQRAYLLSGQHDLDAPGKPAVAGTAIAFELGVDGDVGVPPEFLPGVTDDGPAREAAQNLRISTEDHQRLIDDLGRYPGSRRSAQAVFGLRALLPHLPLHPNGMSLHFISGALKGDRLSEARLQVCALIASKLSAVVDALMGEAFENHLPDAFQHLAHFHFCPPAGLKIDDLLSQLCDALAGPHLQEECWIHERLPQTLCFKRYECLIAIRLHPAQTLAQVVEAIEPQGQTFIPSRRLPLWATGLAAGLFLSISGPDAWQAFQGDMQSVDGHTIAALTLEADGNTQSLSTPPLEMHKKPQPSELQKDMETSPHVSVLEKRSPTTPPARLDRVDTPKAGPQRDKIESTGMQMMQSPSQAGPAQSPAMEKRSIESPNAHHGQAQQQVKHQAQAEIPKEKHIQGHGPQDQGHIEAQIAAQTKASPQGTSRLGAKKQPQSENSGLEEARNLENTLQVKVKRSVQPPTDGPSLEVARQGEPPEEAMPQSIENQAQNRPSTQTPPAEVASLPAQSPKAATCAPWSIDLVGAPLPEGQDSALERRLKRALDPLGAEACETPRTLTVEIRRIYHPTANHYEFPFLIHGEWGGQPVEERFSNRQATATRGAHEIPTVITQQILRALKP